MSELKGFQAHLHRPPKLKGAQLTAQGRPPLLFIAPQTNIAVSPFTGHFLVAPDASVARAIDAAPRVRCTMDCHVSNSSKVPTIGYQSSDSSNAHITSVYRSTRHTPEMIANARMSNRRVCRRANRRAPRVMLHGL
jgi:hypothetical protein